MINPGRIEEVIDGILAAEGGYTNDPNDRGGPTNFGITLDTLRTYKPGAKNATAEDVKNMTVEDAMDIYRKQYCAPFEWVDNATVFKFLANSAVQHGKTGAIKLLQRAVGLQDDGILGPATKGAVAAADSTELLAAIVAERCRYYTAIVHKNPSQAKFICGWVNRIAGDLT